MATATKRAAKTKTPSKKKAAAEAESQDAQDRPVLDMSDAAVKKMIKVARERGYVTYDELNEVLPSEEVTSEQIEDTMTRLSELGINVVEDEEAEESNDEEAAKTATPASRATSTTEEDLGRTDDPVRMYLREMGSVELLSREGEIEIAKRIEAGRDKMISGLCESPITQWAIVRWRDALKDELVLLRDVIWTPPMAAPTTAIWTPSISPPTSKKMTKTTRMKSTATTRTPVRTTTMMTSQKTTSRSRSWRKRSSRR